MKIGELARQAQSTAETIRYYEKEGLLPKPARTEGNYRDYTQSHLDRLRFIRNCRVLGMSHEEIHALLSLAEKAEEDCGTINQLLDTHIEHVCARIGELRYLEKQLKSLRQSCQGAHSVGECNIVQGLAALDIVPLHPGKRSHL